MTRQRMYLKMIVSSLLRRRSRMLIALLAVAIGSTILSGLVTIYYDVPRQMGKEFRSYGANLLLLPAVGREFISEADFEQLRQLSFLQNKIEGITPYRYERVKVNEQPFMVAGVDVEQVKKSSPYWHVFGFFPKNDQEVLIGETVSSITGINAGGRIKIVGLDEKGNYFEKECTVSGVLQTGGTEEETLYLSISALEEMMKEGGYFDIIECSLSAGQNELESFAAKIAEAIPSIAPRLVKRVTHSEGTVLKKLHSLVYIVTLVVLLLTMVCVATTMMAVVAERRREIGLKKALGASNRKIVGEFLGEGVFLGALGGVLGVIFGFIFAQAVSINVFSRPIAFQPLLIPLTMAISMLVTTLACLIPVRSASDVDPAIVLRGE